MCLFNDMTWRQHWTRQSGALRVTLCHQELSLPPKWITPHTGQHWALWPEINKVSISKSGKEKDMWLFLMLKRASGTRRMTFSSLVWCDAISHCLFQTVMVGGGGEAVAVRLAWRKWYDAFIRKLKTSKEKFILVKLSVCCAPQPQVFMNLLKTKIFTIT